MKARRRYRVNYGDGRVGYSHYRSTLDANRSVEIGSDAFIERHVGGDRWVRVKEPRTRRPLDIVPGQRILRDDTIYEVEEIGEDGFVTLRNSGGGSLTLAHAAIVAPRWRSL